MIRRALDRSWAARGLSILATLGLLASPVAAASPLAYRFAAGDSFELVSKTKATVPALGNVEATVVARCKVVSTGAAGSRLDQSVSSSVAGKPDYNTSLSFTVSPAGQISDLGGLDPSDPKSVLIAKNAGSALPALPDEVVTVGTTWQDERLLALPQVKIPFVTVPEQLRVIGSYKVLAIGPVNGKDAVTIQMSISSTADKKVQLAASGNLVVEAATGKPLSSQVVGKAVVKIPFSSLTVPFELDLSSR